MKILILGANGQLGRELSLILSNAYQVYDFSRKELDIENISDVKSKLKSENISLVINAAAYTKVDLAESESETAFRINAESVRNLALACKEQNCFLIHFSTDYVFSGEGEKAWKEDDSCNPCNNYGLSKLKGEKEIQKILNDYLIFRISWVFGEYGNNFPKTILNAAKTKETLKIIGDQFGSPTWTKFIAVHILKILQTHSLETLKAKSGIYHLVPFGECSWFELTNFILENYKKLNPTTNEIVVKDVLKIPSSEYPLPAKRPNNSRLDCSKFETNFFPIKVSWQQGVKHFLKALK